jgi:hypothetical protein
MMVQVVSSLLENAFCRKNLLFFFNPINRRLGARKTDVLGSWFLVLGLTAGTAD